MKARSILTTLAALALVVPATAQAMTGASVAPAGSAQIHAIMVRGEGLNRLYRLGTVKPAGSTPTGSLVRALTLRGEALNRAYGLGAYAHSTRFLSDVASSSEVARASTTTDRSDALSRYEKNVSSGEPTASPFSSDVASSDAVARYQANVERNTTPVASGSESVFQSPATAAGIAAGLLLVAMAGFALARTRNRPLRPV